MSVEFRSAAVAPLRDVTATAPDGATIGILGDDSAGAGALLRMAAGLERPTEGSVTAAEPRRFLGPLDPLDIPDARTLAIEHTFALHDAFGCARARAAIERLRRSGATVLLASHDEPLLREACDEVWWLHDGTLAARGVPSEVLERYRRHVATRLRESGGRAGSPPLAPSLRRGDGRARLVSLDVLGRDERPAMVLASGEPAAVRVVVRFDRDVDDPVVGIMIRTRIGMEVFGTNTLLENLKLGPRRAGETIHVTFAFDCDLCPREYTLTAASHDPDGMWHDWLEDAVVFSVTDSRYTAGVANLRAKVSVDHTI